MAPRLVAQKCQTPKTAKWQGEEIDTAQKIEKAQELLRQAFAILSELAAQNETLKLLAAKPEPTPLPLVTPLPEPPEQDE